MIAAGQTDVPTPQPAALPAPQGSFQPQAIPVGFIDAWRAILTAGQGQPALAGAAAQALAMVCGQQLAPGASYAGAGALAGITISDAVHVLQLAGDFGWRPAAPSSPVAPPTPVAQVAQQAPVMQQGPAPSILPPDAPQSNPALASRPIEHAVPTATITNALNAVAPGLGTAVVQALPTMNPAQASEAPKRGRGRPRKNADTAPAATFTPASASMDRAQAAINGGAPVNLDPLPQDDTGEPVGYPIEIFVDCRVAEPDAAGYPALCSLDSYIERTLAVLVKKFCPSPAIPDIRNAPNDGPLGFGKWKGAIATTVREIPPPPGRYTLSVGNDEIRAEVAAALRTVCLATGGLYVDGR